MWIIAGINAALFISACCGADMSDLYLGAGIESLRARPWSPFTYMFAQTHAAHFSLNIISFIIVGAWFENRLGGLRLAATYLTGGMAGAMAFEAIALIAGTPDATLGGSSAAVLAVYAGIVALYGRRLGNISLGFIGRWSAGLPLCIVLVSSVFELWGDNPGGNLAHIAGILSGWGMGRYLSREATPRNDDSGNIIDKFERSGYSSLTADERRRLFNSQHHNGR